MPPPKKKGKTSKESKGTPKQKLHRKTSGHDGKQNMGGQLGNEISEVNPTKKG